MKGLCYTVKKLACKFRSELFMNWVIKVLCDTEDSVSVKKGHCNGVT